jgi:26S proteasome regulatory subunit N2
MLNSSQYHITNAILQPTGGVILVTDTRPQDPKTLLELKVKKAAPVPAPGATGQSSGTTQDTAAPVTPARASASSSTHIVEEGESEADVPGEFEYQTDGEGGTDD